VSSLVADASIIVTSLIARAEMSAGINRLLGVNYISKDHYSIALRDFRSDWNHYERISVSEEIAGRADLPACEYSLRGYDATHLSCGLTWQDALELPVSLVSFDSELREAARKSGLQVLPE
jgi:predicted nucleic acid-binding protein